MSALDRILNRPFHPMASNSRYTARFWGRDLEYDEDLKKFRDNGDLSNGHSLNAILPILPRMTMKRSMKLRKKCVPESLRGAGSSMGLVSSSMPAVPASSFGLTSLQYPHRASVLHHRFVLLSCSLRFISVSYAFHLSVCRQSQFTA